METLKSAEQESLSFLGLSAAQIAETCVGDDGVFECEGRRNCEEVKYYLYYFSNSSMREVSKKVFSKVKGSVASEYGRKIRFVGDIEKNSSRRFLQTNVIKNMRGNKFVAQGLSDVMTNVSQTVNAILYIYKLVIKLAPTLATINNAMLKLAKAETQLALLDNFVIVATAIQVGDGFSFSKFLSLAYGVGRLFMILNEVIPEFIEWSRNAIKEVSGGVKDKLSSIVSNFTSFFDSEGLESLVFSAASLFMPAKVYKIFERMQKFSSCKFSDDMSLGFELLSLIIEYIKSLVPYIPGLSSLKIPDFFSKSSLLSDYNVIRKCRELIEQATKDVRAFTEERFRTEVSLAMTALESSVSLMEWRRRSAGIDAIFYEMTKLNKRNLSYAAATRQEPACFVLEGSPGTLKSVIMNGVIESLGWSAYSHLTKAMMDGKDWYDSYANEEIFYMDDVGQQGISQWRNLINLVSPVRLPLDCAEAKLKDTKFFSSSTIMLTTNNFSRLQGLTKEDCISDIRALWRRAYVVYFDVDRVGGNLCGELRFKYFDVALGEFVKSFPDDIQSYLQRNNITLLPFVHLDPTPESRAKAISWLCDIVIVTRAMKDEQYDENRKNCRVDVSASSSLPKSLTDKYVTPRSQGVNQQQQPPQVPPVVIAPVPVFVNQALTCEIQSDVELESSLDELSKQLVHGSYDGWANDEDYRVDYIFKVDVKDVGCYLLSLMMDWVKNVAIKIKDVVMKFIARPSLLLKMMGKIIEIMDQSLLITIILLFVSSWCAYRDAKNLAMEVKLEEEKKRRGEFYPESSELHPSVRFIADAVKKVTIHNETNNTTCYGTITGHLVLLPLHVVTGERSYITVYHDYEAKHILLDHARLKPVFEDVNEDVGLYAIPMGSTPFKNLKKHFKPELYRSKRFQQYLLQRDLVIDLATIQSPYNGVVYYQTLFKGQSHSHILNNDRYIAYKKQSQGMCGSLVYDVDGGVIGMHVAGAPDSGVGISVLFSEALLTTLRNYLENDNALYYEQAPSSRVLSDFSGIKLAENFHSSSPKKSNMVKSPLYEVFPVSKEPANLVKYGPHTVKTVAKKSFKPVSDIPIKTLGFAHDVLSSLIPKFGDLSDYEVIKGSDFLAPMNKDSSNGLFSKPLKTDYMDFGSGEFTREMVEELNKLVKDIEGGTVSLKDVVWSEQLKDEIRSLKKEGEPRSFRISRVHIQVLTKRIFGDMIRKMIPNRHFTGIMVGVNPFSEWNKIYDVLRKCVRVWDLDYKCWDGGMLPQVQDMVNEVILSKYTGNYKKVADYLLTNLIYCPVSVNDDVYITNHSMPSGSFLTSYYNSFVNKAIKAMWANYNGITSVDSYLSNTVDYVYGDDTIFGFLRDFPLGDQSKNQNTKNLGAVSMASFIDLIGIQCTDANKNPIVHDTMDLKNLSFLKRSFRFHPQIGGIVCPLDVNTIFSSISFCDQTKDTETVMKDKINSFQREIFLHPELANLRNVLRERCEQEGLSYTELPESYLIELYQRSPSEYLNLPWYDAKYC